MKYADFVTTKKRKISVSEIVLFTILGLLFVLMVTMIVMSFVAISNHTQNVFSQNLIKNYIYIILTAVVLILFDIAIQNGKLYAKEWLFSILYFAILLFLNVLNIFNLYNYFVVNLIAQIALGAIYSLVGVSIYYNYLKNENNKVKAKAFMVVLFAFVFTIAFAFFVELLKWLSCLIFNVTALSFAKIALNVIYAVIGSVVLNLVFYLSLMGKKVFINSCLIDVYKGE